MADNKATALRFYNEVVNGRDVTLIDELVHENVVEHEEFPGFSNDREGVKQFFAMIFEAFPDLRFDVQDIIGEGDKVATRVVMTGTHQGAFMDIPATGKRVEVELIDIVRLEDGKFVEHWGVMDQMTMMQQLGVIPAE
jgi:steroid delta-isomerase-like uncharacterized protein